MDDYKKLLSCWHKLEHFCPAQVPDLTKLNELTENEPWKIPLKSKNQDKTIEYTIYLGVFKMSEVTNFIKSHFKDTQEDENLRNSNICFASLKLDIEGKYINDSFGVSTLPWALKQLEKDKIKSDNWSNDFEKIKTELLDYIELNFKETINNSENEVIKICTIVSTNQLLKFQDKIESVCGWSIKPNKHIYVEWIEKFKSKENNSTTDILNSFYIKDLEKIISEYDSKTNPKAFQDYLNGSLNNKSEQRIDVSKSISELQNSLTPNNYPDGCWPSDYTLSLMQQYAVNNIFNNLSEGNQEGIFSVNGPPGTGKTTLLRDIIAPIIVKRAKELSKLVKPSDAFIKIGSFQKDKSYTFHIYSPSENLTDAGIVITSSNNGAVENISKELPLKQEVSKQYQSTIEYFKDVAENCINKENWGIISAVLGNKQNRNTLASSLWFNNNKDFKDLQQTLRDDKLKNNSEWEKIKSAFNSKLVEINNEKERLEYFKIDYKNYKNIQNLFFQITTDLEKIEQDYTTSKEKFESKKNNIEQLTILKKDTIHELSVIESSKPNFFVYWFNKSKRTTYNKALKTALNTYSQVSEKLELEKLDFSNSEANFNQTKILFENGKQEQLKLSNNLNVLKNEIEKAKSELKNNYADDEFWENINSKKSQEACPWYSSNLKKLQSELFIIALKLNEIFLLTANSESSKISTTLAGFFEYLNGETKASKKEIKAMWDTFFLVIPVVSTTFASVQTMFKDLEKANIPWLFIDEAGQATPQAAVGSIWRSKKVCVVGDPFQIEPVVTIPNLITDNISTHFDLNNNQISSELSVQTMSDRINSLGTYLSINDKEEWIGIPLRVHRRCINPMFEISNKIAYANTMFCSTTNPKKLSINFKTSFIDCKGNVEGKHFIKEQAELVKEILIKEIAIIKDLPDIFVITPFSEISTKLKPFLSEFLINELRKYREIETSIVSNWLSSHIGTVHTFQGKQAEGVIFCLGLDEKTKGAANWASQKPNLLNVALTRAKYRFISRATALTFHV